MVPAAAPSCSDQVTAVFVSPVTDAENVCAAPGAMVATLGEIVTVGPATATVALPDLELSATLVATTWKVPGVPGAVYVPLELTVPPAGPSCTDQVTAAGSPAAPPLTAAANPAEPFTGTDRVGGITATETLPFSWVPLQAALSRIAKTRLVRTLITPPV